MDGYVQRTARLENVVIQVLERRVGSVCAPVSLLPHLVRVLQRVEYGRVSDCAIPPFSSGGVLHQVNPFIPIRYFLVLVPVPLRLLDWQPAKDLELVVEVIEDDHLGMLDDQVADPLEPVRMRVRDSPDKAHHLRDMADWPVLEIVPSFLEDHLVFFPVPLTVDVHRMASGMTLVRHVDCDGFEMPSKRLCLQVTVHLRKLSVRAEHDMTTCEFGTRLVEPVGDEERYVVHPSVTRCGTEKDPLVFLGDPEKRLDPRSMSHDPLLIEDEECVSDVLVGVQVLPGVDDRCYPEEPGFLLPVPGVAFLRCCNHVELDPGR